MEAPESKDITLAADRPRSLLKDKHAAYLEHWGRSTEGFEVVMTEHLRMSGLYWCVTAAELMGVGGRLPREAILAFVESCFDAESGGFAPNPQHDPHLLYTLTALQVLVTYDALKDHHREGAARYVAALQRPDGSFQGDKWGEVDTRFSMCALAALALLNELDRVDVAKAAEFVLACMNFDGGFGVVPGSESHAAQVFCCVGALAISGQLHRVDRDVLGTYLCERQLPSGGFNGRPEKLPDVCYSWWVLSSLAVIDRLHWIDSDRLRDFIYACQDDETGGFADRPLDVADPFHTLFGSAALSLLKDPGLLPVHPIFCMPVDVVARQVKCVPYVPKECRGGAAAAKQQ
eukprot:m.77479 g.77479  ORF g.77479 m.77479 type:complete len:347 (-) comp14700_c0_seq1:281-1321(-)